MRTPDQYDGAEWFRYLLDAIERETGEAWSPPGFEISVWLKLIRRMRDDGAEAYLLALAFDKVATKWDKDKPVSPWELITPGKLFYPFRGVNRPQSFWRAVWFSRYADSPDEVRYYDHWLAQLEAACTADNGTRGRSALWQTAEQKLKQAEEKIINRDKPPTFSYNWLKGWSSA